MLGNSPMLPVFLCTTGKQKYGDYYKLLHQKMHSSTVIGQKGESQNGGNKKTNMLNFPKNDNLLPPDAHTYVSVSGGKK